LFYYVTFLARGLVRPARQFVIVPERFAFLVYRITSL